MYLLIIHQTVLLILLTSFYQLVQGANMFLRSNSAAKNVNHHLSAVTNGIDEERPNGSFSIIVRMMAFGVRRTDDEENDELNDRDRSMTLSANHLSLNKISGDSEEQQTDDVQRNNRLLFLPLMIQMLFERLAEHADATHQLKDTMKISEVNYTSDTDKYSGNKYKAFYKSIQGFIHTTPDMTKIEKTTVIMFVILSFIILLFTIFSIIHRVRDMDEFNTIRTNSSVINRKQVPEETKKLLL